MELQPTRDDGFVDYAPDLKKIDFLNAEAFMATLHGFVRPGMRLRLDLTSVKFIDSSGLGKIIAVLHELRDQGGDMVIAGVQAPVMVLFSLVQLSEIVTIEEGTDRPAAGS